MKFVALLLSTISVNGFVISHGSTGTPSLKLVESENADAVESSAPKYPSVNGWTPDDDAFCYGLPGSLLPVRKFDPLGFAQKGIPLSDIKRYREAEVQHGRVAMMASVGYLVGEAYSPIVWHGGVTGPANDQLAEMPAPLVALLGLVVGATELRRAVIGWVEPTSFKNLFQLRDSYYPGDVGFDPLGLKPSDPKEFAAIQTKELQNGRLAMLAVAGMCAQELVNHKTIFETINYYSMVYSGSDPLENAEKIYDAGIL